MVILEMPWLARHNPEIDWRTEEVKMTRCLEECGKQWRPVQGKSGWEKQKEEEAKEEAGRKREKKEKKKKQKKGRAVEVRKVVGKWEIWDEKEEVAKSEMEAKKLVPEKFHEWIKVFGKKQSKRMPTRKLWDHVIDVKKGEGVPIVKGEKRRSERIHERTVKEGVYPAVEVTTNSAGVLCWKEGW